MALFTTFSKNIDFLRLLFGSHEALAKRLTGILNSNQLSKYATADAVPDAATISSVEQCLKLPPGWALRDNRAFAMLGAQDYELVSSVLTCKPAVKRSLQALLTSLREEA